MAKSIEITKADIQSLPNNNYKIDFDQYTSVEIGGSTEEFRPEVLIKKWGDECFFKLKPRKVYRKNTQIEKGDTKIDSLEMLSDTGKEKFRCYPEAPKKGAEKGVLEVEIDFNEKPASNIVTFDITFSDNLRFIRQEPYDEMEIPPEDVGRVVTRTATHGYDKDGNTIVSMDDNVPGSYAVYQKNVKGIYSSLEEGAKYASGKLFHIYRPKATDNNGAETWCELKIDDDKKTLTVEVPQDFLDNASYPVTVDPTFGKTSLGASSFSFSGYFIGRNAGPGESGEVTTFHVGLEDDWDSGDEVKLALYDAGDSLVSPQSEELNGGHGSQAFVSFDPTSGTVSVTDQLYTIMAWTGSAVGLNRDTGGSSGDSKYSQTAYGTWPSDPTLSNSSSLYSTYATYTAAGGGDPVITSAGDDDFFPNEPDVDVGGTDFGASQTGPADIELGSANTYVGSGTKVSQTVNSWADLLINIDIVLGGLSEGNLWLYVTNSSGDTNADGYAVAVNAPDPVITSIEDDDIHIAEKHIVLVGTELGGQQGLRKLELGNAATYGGSSIKVAQIIESWSNTEIIFDTVQHGLSLGSVWAYVTHEVGEVSDGYALTLSDLPTQLVFEKPGEHTFSVPTGVTSITWEMWGAGGGGGAGGDSGDGGDGGASNYVDGGVTAVTNLKGTAKNPAGQSSDFYDHDAGVGGDGGAGNVGGEGLPGMDGFDGRIVFTWTIPGGGSWLGDWAYRRKVTVQNANIDSDLNWFPLMLKLGSSVGTGSDDVTSIFDELGSNRKKIAITTTDTTTQIFCEIVSWDATTEEAFLFVSRAGLTLSSSGTTDLYIYYDVTKPDNVAYIEEMKYSYPSHSVWNCCFMAVYHMSAEPENINREMNMSGVRQSDSGTATADLTQQQWENYFDGMNQRFTASNRIGLWNVTHLDLNDCVCEFVGSDTDPNILFEESDRHGAMFTAFDNRDDIDIYLGIDLGEADPLRAIAQVLGQYGGYSCVKGVVIDLEWWDVVDWENGNYTTQIMKTMAEAWLATIQGYDAGYKLLLRHPDPDIHPPPAPDFDTDIWLICDDQGFLGLNGTGDYMIPMFKTFIDTFLTHTCIVQIGYNAIWAEGGESRNDKTWWVYHNDPPSFIGNEISRSIKNEGQDLGIVWVDFSVEDTQIDLTSTPNVPVQCSTNHNEHVSSEKQLTSQGGVAARVNGGSDFEASSSDLVLFPESDEHFDLFAALTIEASIKGESFPSWARIFEKPFVTNDPPYTRYCLIIDDASHVSLELSVDETNEAVVGSSTLNTGTLYNVAGTYDGANQRVYLDGAQNGIESLTGRIDINDIAMGLGHSNFSSPTNFFDGIIDEVRLSVVDRGVDYIKANHHSINDNLVDWGNEEAFSVEGWNDNILGVANASVGKFLGVARANIGKIKGTS